jgi:hypothetical protein
MADGTEVADWLRITLIGKPFIRRNTHVVLKLIILLIFPIDSA